VVTIRVDKRAEASQTSLPEELAPFFGPQFRGAPRARRESALGSGVVVRGDGYILTNHHVVNGADRIRVDFADGRSFSGRVVGVDEPSDLAVVRVDATGLPSVPYGDSDRARVGDVVLAFGNPLGQRLSIGGNRGCAKRPGQFGQAQQVACVHRCAVAACRHGE
jgi:S1-C subfamily serine protease